MIKKFKYPTNTGCGAFFLLDLLNFPNITSGLREGVMQNQN